MKNIEFEKLPEPVHTKLSKIDNSYKIAIQLINPQLMLVYLSERMEQTKASLGRYLFTYNKTDNKYICGVMIYSEEEILRVLDLLIFI